VQPFAGGLLVSSRSAVLPLLLARACAELAEEAWRPRTRGCRIWPWIPVTPNHRSALLQPLPDLRGVMPPVHKVKFAPLVRGQWAEEWMIHDLRAGAKPALAIDQA
jgi:hypothetical protein